MNLSFDRKMERLSRQIAAERAPKAPTNGLTVPKASPAPFSAISTAREIDVLQGDIERACEAEQAGPVTSRKVARALIEKWFGPQLKPLASGGFIKPLPVFDPRLRFEAVIPWPSVQRQDGSRAFPPPAEQTARNSDLPSIAPSGSLDGLVLHTTINVGAGVSRQDVADAVKAAQEQLRRNFARRYGAFK